MERTIYYAAMLGEDFNQYAAREFREPGAGRPHSLRSSMVEHVVGTDPAVHLLGKSMIVPGDAKERSDIGTLPWAKLVKNRYVEMFDMPPDTVHIVRETTSYELADDE